MKKKNNLNAGKNWKFYQIRKLKKTVLNGTTKPGKVVEKVEEDKVDTKTLMIFGSKCCKNY